MIKNVAHIGLTVSNLNRSIDFYKNILGLKFEGEMVMEGEATDTLFQLKNCKVKVGYLNGSDNIFSPSVELIEFVNHKSETDKCSLNKTSISELCFYVEDIEQTYNLLLKKGVVFMSKPQLFDFTNQGFGKSKAVYFKDPDGIILELMQVL